jgi:cell division protein YceG involved in septum cleavage
MLGEVHLNRALYKMRPFASKALYRQIAVVEQEQFQVRIFEGRVVQTNPKIIAERSAAEVHTHATLKEALDDAEAEYKKCVVSERWEPYSPPSPQH